MADCATTSASAALIPSSGNADACASFPVYRTSNWTAAMIGISEETPLARFYQDARAARIYDGPSEVHRMAIARSLMRSFLESGTTRDPTGGPA